MRKKFAGVILLFLVPAALLAQAPSNDDGVLWGGRFGVEATHKIDRRWRVGGGAEVEVTGAMEGYHYACGEAAEQERTAWNSMVDDWYSAKDERGLPQTRALGIINEFMKPGDIAVGSAGSLPGDMQRLYRPGNPCTYHMEYGFSCMGYEVNAAVGVKMACPDSEVYTFLGDGSFIMSHSELYTAVQEGIKINIMVFDNSGWGCIENLQNNQGSDTFGTVFRFDAGALALVVGIQKRPYLCDGEFALDMSFGSLSQVLRSLESVHILKADGGFPDVGFLCL